MSMPDLSSAQVSLGRQWTAIMTIPQRVFANWPAMVSFAIVDYASEAIIRMLPRANGYAGFIEGNIVNGARDVIKMATWEAAKVG